jgi:hypothetical protein
MILLRVYGVEHLAAKPRPRAKTAPNLPAPGYDEVFSSGWESLSFERAVEYALTDDEATYIGVPWSTERNLVQ